jgi:hypothetical protein
MNYIINPITNEKYNLNTETGKSILKTYIRHYQQGGAKKDTEAMKICRLCNINYNNMYKYTNPIQNIKQTIWFCNKCVNFLKPYRNTMNSKGKQQLKTAEAHLQSAKNAMRLYNREQLRGPSSSRKRSTPRGASYSYLNTMPVSTIPCDQIKELVDSFITKLKHSSSLYLGGENAPDRIPMRDIYKLLFATPKNKEPETSIKITRAVPYKILLETLNVYLNLLTTCDDWKKIKEAKSLIISLIIKYINDGDGGGEEFINDFTKNKTLEKQLPIMPNFSKPSLERSVPIASTTQPNTIQIPVSTSKK